MDDDKQLVAELLRDYIRGCNTGDVGLLKTTLADDAKVYFLHMPPVFGKHEVAQVWQEFNKETNSRWTIDRLVIDGSEAVMEWSALRFLDGSGQPKLDRGIDWFVLSNGRISEIRQYYDSRDLLAADEPYEQNGFPYRERGYPQKGDFDSMAP